MRTHTYLKFAALSAQPFWNLRENYLAAGRPHFNDSMPDNIIYNPITLINNITTNSKAKSTVEVAQTTQFTRTAVFRRRRNLHTAGVECRDRE